MKNGDSSSGSDTETECITSSELRKLVAPEVLHLVIPRKSPMCVVGHVLPDGLLRLPITKLPLGINCGDAGKVDEVERHIESNLSIQGYVPRLLWNGPKPVVRGERGVEKHKLLLVDALDHDAQLPKPLEWIPANVALHGKWMPTSADEEVRHLNYQFTRVFNEISGKLSLASFEPWETLGWIGRVKAWTREILERRKMVMEGRLRQRGVSGHAVVVSCEVRMRSEGELEDTENREVVFVKTGSPVVREAQRTAAIREVIGNVIPEVIDFHESEGFMLQRNAGKLTDVALDQEALINTIFRMQKLSMNRISELEARGLLVADMDWVESNVESILNHKLLDGYYESVPEEEVNERKRIVEKLRSGVGAIQRGCQKIRKLGLPRTVVHGDLHLGNVGSPSMKDGKTYRIFDWERSFIGNPLHDFESCLWHNLSPGYSLDYEAGVRQIYECWKPCAKLEDMRSVFAVIRMVTDLVRIYDVTRQHDACDESKTDRQDNLFDELCDEIDELCDEIEGIRIIEEVEVTGAHDKQI